MAMRLGLFARPAAVCFVCGAPAGEGAIDGFGERFHSTLCLRRFEKEQARLRRERRRRERNALRTCSTCAR